MAPRKVKTKILSIDGGGIRGIIPGMVLVALERKLQEKSGKKDARIADFFDIIAGTSTGGIIALGLCLPDKPGEPDARPALTSQQVVDLYLKNGEQIFSRSVYEKITNPDGIFDEKYKATGLIDVLKSVLPKDDLQLSEVLKETCITSYDINNRNAYFFNSDKARKNPDDNFYILDVVRATSAAPSYFEPIVVRPVTEQAEDAKNQMVMVDGGLVANNPALVAFIEAQADFGVDCPDTLILSLGTGSVNIPYSFEKAKDWGLVSWIRPLIDILLGAPQAETVKMLNTLFAGDGVADQHLRVDVELSPDQKEESELDNASAGNMANLQKLGEDLAQQYDSQLDAFVAKILAEQE